MLSLRLQRSGVPWNWFTEETRMRYTVILQRESDGGYVAVVPSLPGCVSQGDTREEALKNIGEAAELYIEDVQASGDPLPIEDQREFIELNTSTR
jgi:predicted RNase H-like HicB family nuclease